MGRRSDSDTTAQLMVAFLEQRRWIQARLAERVGLTVAGLRKRLSELQDGGWQLRKEHQQNQVLWVAPDNAFGGNLVLPNEDVGGLLELLLQSPEQPLRQRLVQLAVAALNKQDARNAPIPKGVAAPKLPEETAKLLALCRQAADQQLVVTMKYFSSSRGELDWRDVSPQRIVPGEQPQMIAFCHRSGELRRFRVDQIEAARHDPSKRFRPVPDQELDLFAKTSARGFRRGDVETLVFRVDANDWRSLKANAPWADAEPTIERTGSQVRITLQSAAGDLIARYLLGMGSRVRVETPGLRARMIAIANDALEALHAEESLASHAEASQPISIADRARKRTAGQ